MRNLACLCAGAAFGTLACAALGADQYQFTVDSSMSAATANITVNAPFTGTIIGTDTATTTGSRTKPFSAGNFTTNPEENLPVNMTGAGHVNGDSNTNPSGGFVFGVDTDALTADLTGLSMDMLGGAMPVINTTADLSWESFRTRTPTGTYIGGFPLNGLPVGTSTITVLTATQTDPASGALVPAGGNTYTFAIPVTVEIASTVIVNGAPSESAPQAFPVVFAGTITVEGDSASMAFNIDFMGAQTVPGPFPLPDAVPFTLPVIPFFAPTACPVLLNLTLTELQLSINGGADAEADGVRLIPTGACCDNDQVCTVMTEAACTESGGAYMGDGSVCDVDTCNLPPPVGSCCLDRCLCVLRTATDCANEDGVYLGDGSVCGVDVCFPNTACACDWNGLDGLDSQDYFDFLEGFFGGPSGADFNCADGTDSQDFFDFLECFFSPPAGCQ